MSPVQIRILFWSFFFFVLFSLSIRNGRVFSRTSYRLFAAHEIAPIAGRGRHQILGDDPTEPQWFDFGHVRRRTRFNDELELEAWTAD